MMLIDGLTHDVGHPIGERSSPAQQLMAADACHKEWVDSGQSAA
jgi:hypothetical protein